MVVLDQTPKILEVKFGNIFKFKVHKIDASLMFEVVGSL